MTTLSIQACSLYCKINSSKVKHSEIFKEYREQASCRLYRWLYPSCIKQQRVLFSKLLQSLFCCSIPLNSVITSHDSSILSQTHLHWITRPQKQQKAKQTKNHTLNQKNNHKTHARLQEYIQYKVFRHCHEGFIILTEQSFGREKILLLGNWVLTRSYSPSVLVLRTSFQVAKFWGLLSLYTLQNLFKND